MQTYKLHNPREGVVDIMKDGWTIGTIYLETAEEPFLRNYLYWHGTAKVADLRALEIELNKVFTIKVRTAIDLWALVPRELK